MEIGLDVPWALDFLPEGGSDDKVLLALEIRPPGISVTPVCEALSRQLLLLHGLCLRPQLCVSFKSKCKGSEKLCPETFSGSIPRFPEEKFSFSLATRGKV